MANTPESLAPYIFAPGKDWAAFAPKDEADAPAFAMNDWLERPAGKSGRVRIDGQGRLAHPDGSPVRWWGTNFQYAENAPPREQADLHAARLAAWGVNCVRLHKFTDPSRWAGFGDKDDVTQWEPGGLDRFDYLLHRLQQEGVRYGISHTFGLAIPEGSRDRVLAYDEIQWQGKKGVAYALINVAEDIQDLMIEKIVNLLKHRNPHTGTTIAENPALSFIELQNEDDIFFFTLREILAQAPTYRTKYEQDFAAWIKTRYPTGEALAAAWKGALGKGDEWGKQIAVETNPWILGADSLPKITGGKRRRLLDQAAFMEATQMKLYNRFVKAIRDAGYDRPLIGSPWQAPAGLPHLLNLRCDARVGIVDRHNYWGGGAWWMPPRWRRPRAGPSVPACSRSPGTRSCCRNGTRSGRRYTRRTCRW